VCKTWSLPLREEHTLRVYENRMLRRIFGPKRGEVAGDWRRLHNEELHNIYASTVIRVIKSRKMTWTGHVAHMGENFYFKDMKERDHLEELCIDGQIILEWIRKIEWGGVD
jgi:hypothetical protein